MPRRRRTSLGVLALLAIVTTGVSSGASSPPGKSPPVLRKPPSISGVAVEGQTLTATPGEWSGPVTKYAFYWARCDADGGACSAIAGATGVTFVLSATDVGKTLRVTVIATNKNGSTIATSAPSAVVTSAAAAPPPASPPPPPPPAAPETVLTSVICGATGTASCSDGNNNGGESIVVTYSVSNADSAEIQLGAGSPWKPLGASPAGSWVDASCSPITVSVRAKRSSDGVLDASPASAELTVTPFGGCAPPPPPPSSDVSAPTADALFSTGFEADSWMDARICNRENWNQWQFMNGVDQRTGYNFDSGRLFGNPKPWGALDVAVSGTGTVPDTGLSCDYQENSIVTVTGHDGQPTRAEKNVLKRNNPNACCEGSGGFGVSELSQDPAVNTGKRLYIRYRMFIDPGIQNYAMLNPASFWTVSFGMKTPVYLRIHPMIYVRNGQLVWNPEIDSCGANPRYGCGGPYPEIDYQKFPTTTSVPLGRWFTQEIRWVLANDSTGYFGFAVDGKTVAQSSGPIMGSDSSKWKPLELPNNFSLNSVYSYGNAPFYNMIDDIQVRNEPPCSVFPCGSP